MSASSAAWPGPALAPAKLLTLDFEGYYMCRLSTDPDPTDEYRGMSGYTMALSTEDPFDRIIRLEVDEAFAARNLRPPARDRGVEIGVRVTAVAFDGRPWPHHPLVGARVRLGGRDEPAAGPVFESRNNLTGSDDNFAFVVDPFCLHVESTCGSIAIQAEDHIDPTHPGRPIWEVLDPSIYGRRLPHSTEANSTEVAQAIGVFDLYGYFRDRRRYLQEQIRLGDVALAEVPMKDEAGREAIETRIQQFRSRLYQLEFWGDRVIGKLGNKVDWAFDINGRQAVKDPEGRLGGKADLRQPWPIRFWFGGWDGDLLVGYLRGNLGLPFTVTR
jgi:hypothetical protein